MKPSISIVALLAFLLIGYPEAHADSAPSMQEKHNTNITMSFKEPEKYDERNLVVKFAPDAEPALKRKILQGISAQELDSTINGFTLVSVPSGSDLTALSRKLLKNRAVELVEPNYEIKSTFKPTDPAFGKQWYLNKISMPASWDITKGTAGVTVAVVDGGFSMVHPDLKGRFVHPYNAVTGETKLPSGDHATHVSGIIGASMNRIGTAGIAPSVKIMPVNVFLGDAADSYWVADGIRYAVDSGADIINLSLTTDVYSSVLDHAVKYAASKGVVVVAAAGNSHSSKKFYPAALDSVIGVSAVDSKDQLAPFSNYGSYIDFSAPGVKIYSTISQGRYAMMDGTSMASPVVSGVSALILSKNPFLKPAETMQILKKSAVDLGTKERDNKFGYGRVDAYNALQNTPSPMSTVSLSAKTFIEDGKNQLDISFSAHKNTYVSLYVKDGKGRIVKKLIWNKAWSGGKVSYHWNGKLDTGAYAPSGTYKIYAKASNKKHKLYKTASVMIQDDILPAVSFSKSSLVFSPAVKTKLDIPFTLNKNANVTAAVYDSQGKLIRTLHEKTAFTGGTQLIAWDGKDGGNKRVKDGIYKLTVSADDQEGRPGEKNSMAIAVDTAAPAATIAASSKLFKMDGKTKLNAKGTIKETARVTVKVIDTTGTAVKTLVSVQSWKTGTSTIAWDGKTAKNTFAKEGNYQFVLEATDAAGNKRTAKSASFKVDDIR
ncbi:S8 family serine peptidase [Peribacillus glennii]|uniref:Peptidase S8 n=1 Tax=Peribacillus glennii TaxID=2303991 RepID=A0A372LDC2_9BACI|nr:S8 family serine peptidase [Peribacillus glennii]RFU63974.1 hypothetical protein D0466_11040 [Peribacillus glennii]